MALYSPAQIQAAINAARSGQQARQQPAPLKAASPAITYTPHGIARAPGYYDKTNLYDTGYAGQRNSEHGGGKITHDNWDYDLGRPKAGAQLGADGLFSLGGQAGGAGGGGGGFNPRAGTYGLDVAKAKYAYDRAVSQSDEGVQKLNRASGFMRTTDGKTQIDPHNRFGALQLMLGQHGRQLNDAWSAASERRIGHKGLGAQGETDLRFTHAGQMADLGNQYSDSYKNYLQMRADALAEYEFAKQMAMFNATSEGDWYEGGGYGDPLDGGGLGDPFAPLANASAAQLAKAIAAANKPKPKKATAPASRNPGVAGSAGKPGASMPAYKPPAPKAPAPKPAAKKNTSRKGGV